MHLQGWFSPCNGHETWSQRIISKICPTKNPKVNSIDCPLIGLKKSITGLTLNVNKLFQQININRKNFHVSPPDDTLA